MPAKQKKARMGHDDSFAKPSLRRAYSSGLVTAALFIFSDFFVQLLAQPSRTGSRSSCS